MDLTNPATERALLGCILFDNRILDELRVTDDLFSDALNLEIWCEIGKARARGSVANLPELGLRLPDKVAYLSELTDCALSNGKQYKDELKEFSNRRQLFDTAKGIANLIKDGEPSDKISEYCEQRLTAMSENAETGYKHVSVVIPRVIDEIEKAYNLKGELSGIPTGFEKLDAMTNGWQPSEVWIIGARPAVGKTASMLNFTKAALASIKKETGINRKAGIFSAEMSDTSLLKRDIADESSVDHSRIRSGYFASGDMDAIHEAMGTLSDKGLYICDTPNITKTALISEARKMRRKEKVDIIFIDYIGLIQNENRDIPRHEQIAEISRSLKGLARELRIPIIALSQVTRDAEGKRPTMANIRESGSIEQDSDGIAFLWDNGEYSHDVEKITLIVAKQRNGPCGDIPLLFYKNKMRFRQAEVERWD
jgi:replicative DNA helicase